MSLDDFLKLFDIAEDIYRQKRKKYLKKNNIIDGEETNEDDKNEEEETTTAELNAKKIDARIQKIMTVRSNLQDPAFQSKVLQAAQADFSAQYDSFEEKCDNNLDLIVFSNKVYELSTGIVRDPKPKDYVITHVGYEYDEAKMNNTEKRNEIYEALQKIFPQEGVLDYVLKYLASCISGYT